MKTICSASPVVSLPGASFDSFQPLADQMAAAHGAAVIPDPTSTGPVRQMPSPLGTDGLVWGCEPPETPLLILLLQLLKAALQHAVRYLAGMSLRRFLLSTAETCA